MSYEIFSKRLGKGFILSYEIFAKRLGKVFILICKIFFEDNFSVRKHENFGNKGLLFNVSNKKKHFHDQKRLKFL